MMCADDQEVSVTDRIMYVAKATLTVDALCDSDTVVRVRWPLVDAYWIESALNESARERPRILVVAGELRGSLPGMSSSS